MRKTEKPKASILNISTRIKGQKLPKKYQKIPLSSPRLSPPLSVSNALISFSPKRHSFPLCSHSISTTPLLPTPHLSPHPTEHKIDSGISVSHHFTLRTRSLSTVVILRAHRLGGALGKRLFTPTSPQSESIGRGCGGR